MITLHQICNMVLNQRHICFCSFKFAMRKTGLDTLNNGAKDNHGSSGDNLQDLICCQDQYRSNQPHKYDASLELCNKLENRKESTNLQRI